MRRNVLSTESEFMFICFQWCCISTISTGGFAKASSSSASKSESWLLSEPVLIVTEHFPSVNRGALTSPKEACDHAFTSKTANWGWAQFAKRDAVFYTPNTVRHVDAFLIVCNITTAPVAPSVVSPMPIRTVPKGLLHAVGDMLDDPTYSDVCFVLPAKKRRGNMGRARKAKIIYAAKKILQRVDYFDTSTLKLVAGACIMDHSNVFHRQCSLQASPKVYLMR